MYLDYTTQEYFMSQKDKFFPHFQETIMHTCMTYMLFNDNSNTHNDIDFPTQVPMCRTDDYHPNIPYSYEYRPFCPDNYEYWIFGSDLDGIKYKFLSYSLKYWAYHASKLQHTMVHEIIAFLNSACCRKVAKLFHAAIVSTEVPVRLHLAVDYGLLHITEVLLDQGDNPCQCETPLLVTAIKRENFEMVKLLLDHDKIDPNTPLSWVLGGQQTPLSYAAV